MGILRPRQGDPLRILRSVVSPYCIYGFHALLRTFQMLVSLGIVLRGVRIFGI